MSGKRLALYIGTAAFLGVLFAIVCLGSFDSSKALGQASIVIGISVLDCVLIALQVRSLHKEPTLIPAVCLGLFLPAVVLGLVAVTVQRDGNVTFSVVFTATFGMPLLPILGVCGMILLTSIAKTSEA